MSKVIRITKTFTFEAAHVLEGYDGPCSNIHGHSYNLSVTIKGKLIANPNHPKDGMVMDFKELKAIVQEQIISVFDHSLILKENTKLHLDNLDDFKIVQVPFQPTSENLIAYFADKIRDHLPLNLRLSSLKLAETATSYAEWFECDQ